MKKLLQLAAALTLLATLLQPHSARAQSTAFTYQGSLTDSGSPANGTYDLSFGLYDAVIAGTQQGGSVTNATTSVTNGLFTVALDFGATPFNGSNRWLQISVRTNGSAADYAILSPRQPLTPVPYALYALTPAGTNGLNGTNGLSGLDGTNGLNGINGTNGLAGLNGTSGVNGTNGLDGATGPQGPAGLTGGQGPQGVQGIQGVAGINGTNGVNGLNGTNGATGPAGPLLPDVALVDTNQIFTGSNTFSGVLIATNATNQITGSFTGNGGGLTNLNVSGSQITGVIPLAQLPASVVTNGASGVNISGTFSGNGAGVTNLNLSTANSQGAISFATNYFFTLASTPGVGSEPNSVVAATNLFNHGEIDLISANYTGGGAGTPTVLTNNGSGGFVVASSPGVGNGPVSVVAADVNNDGKLDLICANYIGNTLTVLTNNGSGGFVQASSPVVGNGPNSVVAADVNGDGKVDLISANEGANTLTVLTNNGSGGFVIASSPGVGNGPVSVVAADVNGDGKVDLISANNNASGTLTVLTNNGSGGFVIASSPGVGSFPNSVVAADVNNDGKLDLICANFGANTLTVLTNNGSGGFVVASTLIVGSEPELVVAADVNGDGKVDLICANFGGNSLTVLTNTTTIISTFTGNGSGLTSISDTALSTNVALRAGGNAFTGNQTITSGNVGIGTTAPGDTLEVNGGIRTTGPTTASSGSEVEIDYSGGVSGSGRIFAYNRTGNAYLDMNVGNGMVVKANGSVTTIGTVNGSSDRNVKENFAQINPREVLEKVAVLPITRWNYKADTAETHLGPMAQDFYAAFTLGMDDKHISMVDADGVALAAIQGLNQKVEEKDAEIQELKARLEKLEQLLNAKNGEAK